MLSLTNKRSIIICSVLTFLIIVPFSILGVEALYGGGVGLNLNPSSGVTGTVVQVSLDIPSWLKTQSTYESPSSYYNTEFSLFWDIGGWGYIPVPVELQNLAKTSIPIGTAQVDSKGFLTGKVTIPSSDVGDEHVIFAVPKNPDAMETLSHFWGFFHVTGTGTASSPTSTPTPTPTPTPSPSSHPDYCTLTVRKNGDFAIQIQDVNFLNDSYSVEWPYGTTIKLHATYQGSSNNEFGEWEWVDSNGKHSQPTNTVYIELTSNTEAYPKTKPHFDIPGFPLESILIGLSLAIGLLYMSKRKLTTRTSFPI